MSVQEAVKKAQKKVGLNAQQPALPAGSLLELWRGAVADAICLVLPKQMVT